MTVQRASGGIDYMNLAEFEIVTSESLHQPIRSDVFKWNTVSDEELSQECPESHPFAFNQVVLGEYLSNERNKYQKGFL